MPDERPPDELHRLAEQRRAARVAHDWPVADRIKAEIEAAGWRVVDQGRGYSLHRAHPPDAVEDGAIRYGASSSVPSVLDDAPTLPVTVVRAVSDDAPAVGATPSAIDAGPAQSVLVANRPAAALPAGAPEVVLLNGWPGTAAALNAGIRRARGAVVVLAAPGVDVPAAEVDALVHALDDPSVAVAGPVGLLSGDLRRFRTWSSETGDRDPVAIDGRMLAFRRSDYLERGPLDEAFVDPYRLDVWWSLVLRDEGPDLPPRRAVVVGTPVLPVVETGSDAGTVAPREPGPRRNFYRLLRAFGGARHLLGEP